jgi:hypothetical protein
MNLTKTNATIKIVSPTLHLYYYVLRNGMNDRLEALEKRRQFFNDNLQKITSHLTSSTGGNAGEFINLIPLEQDSSISGSVLDFSQVPPECQKPNNDRLYLTTGIINSRLAARRLNDTYLLRLTRYISSVEGEQSLDIFANLSEHLGDLQIELGQTVILAGILPFQTTSEENHTIAATCLSKYLNHAIDPDNLIADKFLGSPFYIYAKPVTFKQLNDYSIESIQLACAFFYQDEATEKAADKVYRIFQYLLLSYHKINFFYSQSLILKSLLEEQYKKIECLTEDYSRQKWDSQSLKKIPQESLQYYQRLAFLEDQAKSVEVNLKNYQECLQQIGEKTGQTLPKFFINFERDIVFYLEQMKADIGFLSPALHLYEKLMLSVQTQVGINEAEIQEIQNLRQAQLGQIFAGIGTAIALGQILTQPITTTISQKLEPTQTTPSLTSLWWGASASIIISLLIGYLISLVAYRWLIKD